MNNYDIAKKSNIDHKIIYTGYTKKLDVWVPHDLTESLLKQNEIEILMHPPYNPDLAPSDYHLFRSLQNFLNGVNLISKEAYENHFGFLPRNQKFYIDRIMVLPEK
ncbi:SETMR methyltransferase, partial [Acromyrmex heyeri]